MSSYKPRAHSPALGNRGGLGLEALNRVGDPLETVKLSSEYAAIPHEICAVASHWFGVNPGRRTFLACSHSLDPLPLTLE
jgi:hypothetical protein